MKALIIADDLSGAADCAAAARLAATVVFGNRILGQSDVVAVDLDSRNVGPAIAARRAGEALERMSVDDDTLVYCKMDSTLRGNWAAEIAALRAGVARRHRRAPLTIISPALPERGRTVRDGRAFLNGRPLEESALWGADRGGVADLVSICHEQGLPAVSLGSGIERATLQRQLAEAAEAATVVIGDVETRQDAEVLAWAGLRMRAPILWAGSAGLIGSLAGQLGWHSAPMPFVPVTGPVLIAIGSASPVSHQQFGRLDRDPTMLAETIAPDELLRPNGSLAARQQRLEGALTAGRDVSVRIGARSVDDIGLAQAFAKFIAPLAKRAGALVLTGGETAREVLSRLGVTALQLRGEVETAVPIAITSGAVVMPVVTKAGAFGDEDTLFRCREILRGRHKLFPYDRGLPE